MTSIKDEEREAKVGSLTAQRLQAIDLLKIYGNIEYNWNLYTDRLEWQGPFNRLISPTIPLVTGSSFGHLLSIKSFEKRIQALTEASTAADPYYSVLYDLSLPYHERTLIVEEGEIIKSGTAPQQLSGYIRFVDPSNTEEMAIIQDHDLTGYDAVTGLPGREVMFETLASIVEQANRAQVPGAYVIVTIDRLTLLGIQFGVKTLQGLFKQLTERFRRIIRTTDFMGRISSTCLGLILPDCDQYGIVRVTERLERAVQSTPFSLNDKLDLHLPISMGCIVFPIQNLDTVELMEQAEKSLFETQALKGIGTFAPPAFTSLYTLKRHNKQHHQQTGFNRRARDPQSE
jgi:diguanylate cyclase (GGDEF)-like protein